MCVYEMYKNRSYKTKCYQIIWSMQIFVCHSRTCEKERGHLILLRIFYWHQKFLSILREFLYVTNTHFLTKFSHPIQHFVYTDHVVYFGCTYRNLHELMMIIIELRKKFTYSHTRMDDHMRKRWVLVWEWTVIL